MEASTARITAINGIIETVGKHVIAQQVLAGGAKYVRVDEPAQGGVIVAGLEVVEAQLTNALVTVS